MKEALRKRMRIFPEIGMMFAEQRTIVRHSMMFQLMMQRSNLVVKIPVKMKWKLVAEKSLMQSFVLEKN